MISSSEAIYLLVSTGTILGAILPILVFAIPKLLLAYGLASPPTKSKSSDRSEGLGRSSIRSSMFQVEQGHK
ncbi:hypothetical protein HDV00_006704 [Rhizophlyctis rosea]|nr:hypothetical protein HDV00_006704 [Rhizophlyctis rosea]